MRNWILPRTIMILPIINTAIPTESAVKFPCSRAMTPTTRGISETKVVTQPMSCRNAPGRDSFAPHSGHIVMPSSTFVPQAAHASILYLQMIFAKSLSPDVMAIPTLRPASHPVSERTERSPRALEGSVYGGTCRRFSPSDDDRSLTSRVQENRALPVDSPPGPVDVCDQHRHEAQVALMAAQREGDGLLRVVPEPPAQLHRSSSNIDPHGASSFHPSTPHPEGSTRTKEEFKKT